MKGLPNKITGPDWQTERTEKLGLFLLVRSRYC